MSNPQNDSHEHPAPRPSYPLVLVPFRRLSIRWRMTLWNTAAFAVVLISFGILIYGLLRETHFNQIDRVLRERYAQLSDRDLSSGDPRERLQRWLRMTGEHVEIDGIVFDSHGALVAQADDLGAVEQVPVPPAASDAPRFDTITLREKGSMRRLVAGLSAGGEKYTLVLLAELEHVEEEMSQVARALAITVPPTLIAAALLAYLLARAALAPVEHLRRQADEITAARLDRRLPISHPDDELGLLGKTINAMIARLERSFEEVRRFTADASHELRTPIAVIRSEAELALESLGANQEAQSRCVSILEECARLTSLTDQLLWLCREDAGAALSRSEMVPLSALVADSVEVVRPWAGVKQIELKLHRFAEVTVVGDPDRLRRAVLNLLDNAIKYTPQRGRVEVSVTSTGNEALIEITDSGVGISPEHLPFVFDRFYRSSETKAANGPGAGLGLSIVKSLVAAHGGRIEIESEPGSGTTLRVYLPAAAAAGPDDCPMTQI